MANNASRPTAMATGESVKDEQVARRIIFMEKTVCKIRPDYP
jgi:hypothetical protein